MTGIGLGTDHPLMAKKKSGQDLSLARFTSVGPVAAGSAAIPGEDTAELEVVG
jgi:hypothetical protein